MLELQDKFWGLVETQQKVAEDLLQAVAGLGWLCPRKESSQEMRLVELQCRCFYNHAADLADCKPLAYSIAVCLMLLQQHLNKVKQ